MGNPGSSAAGPPPRILVVDDDPRVREQVGAFLAGCGYAIRTAASGPQALAMVRQEPADVVVTDLVMPRMSGIDLLGLLKELAPAPMVIFLTGNGSLESAVAALRRGLAFDFLAKPLVDPDELVVAIEAALSRQRSDGPIDAVAATAEGAVLTARERDLLRLLGQGLDNAAIATSLGLSDHTVRNQLTGLYEKIGAANRVQAALFAYKAGLC